MILILAGTREARSLSQMLAQAGLIGLMSFAGTTRAPQSKYLPHRIGGFGGVSGLRQFLRSHQVRAVVDATHPFARQMSAHAYMACGAERVPHMRIERPDWQPQSGDHWLHAARAECVGPLLRANVAPDSRLFMTTGPAKIAAYDVQGYTGLIRRVDPPEQAAPGGWDWHVARPPFKLADELALLQREQIAALVSKNSGGPRAAKLDAARQLGLPVIMVARAPLPAGLPHVERADEAFEWVTQYAVD